MKVLAKLVFGTLGCVLLISGIAVMSPRAVRAVVATIIRDQDNPARHPFTTTCTGASTTQVSTCNPPAGAAAMCVGIGFSAVSDCVSILDQAARSIGVSASLWLSVCHPSTLRMVI